LSLHRVGLSIGSTDPLRRDHLQRLRKLVDELQPALVCEHLNRSSVDSLHVNDLLLLTQTSEALAHVVVRVQQVSEGSWFRGLPGAAHPGARRPGTGPPRLPGPQAAWRGVAAASGYRFTARAAFELELRTLQQRMQGIETSASASG
jgi:hypothetical protein